MVNTLLGKKQNMTTVFNRFGFQVPATLIVVEPNIIVFQNSEKATIGMGKRKKIKKTENAISKTSGYTPRFLKEIKFQKIQENSNIPVGNKLTVKIFEAGDEVKITGTTKGRGFAGGIKRHGFHGGPKTHGQSDRHRAPGSIGSGTTPGRVWKGKRMAGHMGAAKLTVTGLEVIEIDEAKNTILVKGAVPGAKNGFLIIEKTGKVKGYTPPPAPNEEKQAEKEEKAELEAKEEKATAGSDENLDISSKKEEADVNEPKEGKGEESAS